MVLYPTFNVKLCSFIRITQENSYREQKFLFFLFYQKIFKRFSPLLRSLISLRNNFKPSYENGTLLKELIKFALKYLAN